MKLGLQLETTQKLALTPELRQGIEILQMTAIELNQTINKELLENPLLEFTESHNEQLPESGIQWENVAVEYDNRGYQEGYDYSRPAPDNDYDFQKIYSEDMNLHTYLTFQWEMLAEDLDERLSTIGESLIDAVDSDGYLRQYTGIVEQYGEADTERALEILQGLDPAGVGARTVQECLWLQLKETIYNTPIYKELVNGYLEDLAENRLVKIQERLKLEEDELFRFKQFLTGLEPRPGLIFKSGERVSYVVPDCFLTWEGETPVVRISENSTPKLKISNQYRSILRDPFADEKTKNYVKERLNKALILIKNIESRRETLKKVITHMVTVQKQFFKDGTLVPLTMQEVADGIDMHESTVSRAVRGKYLQTTGGSIALKSLFVRGLAKDKSEVSVDSVKKSIVQLINDENKAKPLSDEAITRNLKERGIVIARRTVAKYREELGFYASSKRRVKKS